MIWQGKNYWQCPTSAMTASREPSRIRGSVDNDNPWETIGTIAGEISVPQSYDTDGVATSSWAMIALTSIGRNKILSCLMSIHLARDNTCQRWARKNLPAWTTPHLSCRYSRPQRTCFATLLTILTRKRSPSSLWIQMSHIKQDCAWTLDARVERPWS